MYNLQLPQITSKIPHGHRGRHDHHCLHNHGCHGGHGGYGGHGHGGLKTHFVYHFGNLEVGNKVDTAIMRKMFIQI